MKKLFNYSFLFLLPFVNIMLLIGCQNKSSDPKPQISNAANIDLNKNYLKTPQLDSSSQKFLDFYNKNSPIKKNLINAFMEEVSSEKSNENAIKKNYEKLNQITWEVIAKKYLTEEVKQQLELDPNLKEMSLKFFKLATFLYDEAEVKKIVNAIQKETPFYKLIKSFSNYNDINFIFSCGKIFYNYDFKKAPTSKINQIEYLKQFLKTKINNLANFPEIDDDTILTSYFFNQIILINSNFLLLRFILNINGINDIIDKWKSVNPNFFKDIPPDSLLGITYVFLFSRYFIRYYSEGLFVTFGNEFLTEYLPQMRSNIKKSNDNNWKQMIHSFITFFITTTILFLLVYAISRIVVWKWKDEPDSSD